MHHLSEQLHLNIRKIRQQRDISPEQMADIIGISTRAYADLEGGHTKIDIQRLEKIAQALEVSVEQLLHYHEKSVSNHFNNHENSHCVVANNNVYMIDKEVYEQWREMYLNEKEAHRQTYLGLQAKLDAREEEIKKMLELLLEKG